MYKKLIEKAYKHWKTYLHNGCPAHKGKEIHHIYGRIGILKCCPLLMKMLTKTEHNDYKIIKQLRVSYLPVKHEVERNYIRHEACERTIWIACLSCPMYLDRNKT